MSTLSNPSNSTTYTGKGVAAVTALGSGGELFEMVVNELATGGLNHTSDVRLGVVRLSLAEGHSLGHC